MQIASCLGLWRNRCAVSNSLKVDNIITHHTGEIVLDPMHHGNIVCPLLPRDLESNILDNCPSIVVEDHIRWNSMNEKLVQISLMSPVFSDGVANYQPSTYQ